MMERTESAQKIYTRMRLCEFPDNYVIEPSDGSSGSSLVVSRADGSMKLTDEPIPACGAFCSPKVHTIFGVVGMLKLIAGSYLIVIMERECVGSYLGCPIFKVLALKIFSCDICLQGTTDEQKKMEAEFSRLLNLAELTYGLYFSYETNLTLSTQRLHDLGDESKLLPLWRQAEPRFLWNNYMLEVLIDHKLDPFLLPVLQGSFQNFQEVIGNKRIDVTLIARRCTRRNGTRMWRRGADSDGYVANFVESEQIVQCNGYTASFVQIRGSIPLIWEQIVDLSYKPKFQIMQIEEASQIVERHFLDLRKKYENVLALDLVNKHGSEGRLSEKFANAMHHVIGEEVRYLHFDFHQICGHVHFDRLSILYDKIVDFLEQNGYFLLNEKCEKNDEQKGIVRTNCIDCLDRTNVTQSYMGQRMLELQLKKIGALNVNDTINSYPNFDERFKILWANHGDDISIQYSGTPALKGDFVRCGQRTLHGFLKDGWNALVRYYLNNFCDGTKQDAIDLLQGHYIATSSRDLTASPPTGAMETIAYFPLALSLVLTGLYFSLTSLYQVRYDIRYLPTSALWTSLSVGIAAVMKTNGRVFCNRPRLLKPRC